MKYSKVILTLLLLILVSVAALAQENDEVAGEENNSGVKASVYYSYGNYSDDRSTHSIATYFQYYRGEDFKVWAGYNNIRNLYPDYNQDIINTGTYFKVSEKNALQLDYFYINDTNEDRGDIYAIEYFYSARDDVILAFGYSYSDYRIKNIDQLTPRFIYAITPRLWGDSKVYITSPSDGDSTVAFRQKMTYYFSPELNLVFGGSFGDRVNPVETENSTVFTQFDTIDSSFFAGLNYNTSQNTEFKIQYDYVHFKDYSVSYITTGFGIKW